MIHGPPLTICILPFTIVTSLVLLLVYSTGNPLDAVASGEKSAVPKGLDAIGLNVIV